MKENATSGKLQRVESFLFTWKIQNFLKHNANDFRSENFTALGHKWRVLLLPKGNPKWKAIPDHLLLYLRIVDSSTLRNGLNTHAKLRVSVVSEVDQHTIEEEAVHSFNASKSDPGFAALIRHCELRIPGRSFVVEDRVTVRAEVWVCELEKVQELNGKENAYLNMALPLAEAKTLSSSIAELDALLFDIHNLLGDKTRDVARAANAFTPFQLSEDDISRAKTSFEAYSKLKLSSILSSGGEPELKNALSIMLLGNALSHKASHEVAKFLSEFDLCLAARQDLRESERKESSLVPNEVKADLRRVFQEFAVIKNRVKEKVGPGDGLQELAARAMAAKEALVNAEQEKRVLVEKKERAEEMIGNVERLWECLKKQCGC